MKTKAVRLVILFLVVALILSGCGAVEAEEAIEIAGSLGAREAPEIIGIEAGAAAGTSVLTAEEQSAVGEIIGATEKIASNQAQTTADTLSLTEKIRAKLANTTAQVTKDTTCFALTKRVYDGHWPTNDEFTSFARQEVVSKLFPFNQISLSYITDIYNSVMNVLREADRQRQLTEAMVVSYCGPVHPESNAPSTPVGSDSSDITTIRLEDTDWSGGFTLDDGIYGGRTAQWIYGTSTAYNTMVATFNIPGQPAGEVEFTVEGMDSENEPKTPISINVNGQEVYNGPNPLPDDDGVPISELRDRGQWGNYTWHISANYFHAGSNEISISNQAEGKMGRPPFFMLDYADLTYSTRSFQFALPTATP
jgi:hypothetical protein